MAIVEAQQGRLVRAALALGTGFCADSANLLVSAFAMALLHSALTGLQADPVIHVAGASSTASSHFALWQGENEARLKTGPENRSANASGTGLLLSGSLESVETGYRTDVDGN